MTPIDLLLHPVRLRIVQALLDGRPCTTAELGARLPDVSTATLYRHVAVLADAEVLEVLGERPVRGAVERTYRLRWDRAAIDADTRSAMTRDDHRRAFGAFAAGLLADFDRYLGAPSADPGADGVVYRQAALWSTDEEHRALVAELEAVVAAHGGRSPGEGRRRRRISLVVVPEDPEGS